MTFYVACPDCHTSVPVEERKEIATLRAQLAEAKQEARGWKLRVDEAAEVVGRLEQERNTAIADAKRMREALEPFASQAEFHTMASYPSGNACNNCGDDWPCSFIQARAALSAPTEKPWTKTPTCSHGSEELCDCALDRKPNANRTGE